MEFSSWVLDRDFFFFFLIQVGLGDDAEIQCHGDSQEDQKRIF